MAQLIPSILELRDRWKSAEGKSDALDQEFHALVDFMRAIGLDVPPTLANGLPVLKDAMKKEIEMPKKPTGGYGSSTMKPSTKKGGKGVKGGKK